MVKCRGEIYFLVFSFLTALVLIVFKKRYAITEMLKPLFKRHIMKRCTKNYFNSIPAPLPSDSKLFTTRIIHYYNYYSNFGRTFTKIFKSLDSLFAVVVRVSYLNILLMIRIHKTTTGSLSVFSF